jgi:polyhydroxyalkanoic acid synthase PhaR subunit
MTRDYNMFEMWKDFYDQSSNLVDQKVKEDFPSQGMGQILEMNLLFKKMLNETTERYLEQVNIPSRNDIANISSLIVNVDSKVDDLEELVEETKENQVSQAELKREVTNLKREMKGLDGKLEQIITLLKAPKQTNAPANTKAAAIAEKPKQNN